MKVAMPIEGTNINMHFGKSKNFIVASIDNESITKVENISSEELMHNHEGIADLLISKEVSVVITGGIGQGALTALEAKSLKVIRGAEGNYEDVLKKFMEGTLKSKNVVCQHHHDHHHDKENNKGIL